MKYDRIDREIIHVLQGDLPLTSYPYKELAKQLGISEEEILNRMKNLISIGVLRRTGAILRHQKAGYVANAMVLWNADPSRIDSIGELMASFPEVSHCYHREFFEYTLFTMIHAKTEKELLYLVEQMAALCGIDDYTIVKSIQELKKVSMEYI